MVLTPHPGEFARLTGATIAEVQADRIAAGRATGGRSRIRWSSSSKGPAPS